MGKTVLFVLCWALLSASFCQSDQTFHKTGGHTFRRINTIKDLRDIQPGHSFPRHGLMLLYYLAQNLHIDQNNVITINLVPSRQDVGFHYYGDREGLFPPLPDQNRMSYYSLGNIYSPGASQLPESVTWNANQEPNNNERNRDRILLSYHRNRRTVGDIYITQHYSDPYLTYYDTSNTYQITTEVLRETQQLIQNTDNSLFVFLYLAGYRDNTYTGTCRILPPSSGSSSRAVSNSEANKTSSLSETTNQANVHSSTTNQMSPAQMTISLAKMWVDDQNRECGQIKLEVKTTETGWAQIKWDNIPLNLLGSNVQVKLNSNGADVETVDVGSHSYGTRDTSQYMNGGLQLNLVDSGSVIKRGSVTDDADRKIPVDIRGEDAALQMYVKGGWAGARLYIKKTFTNWRETFYYSWIGFYGTTDHGDLLLFLKNIMVNDPGELQFSPPSTNEYYTYQWVTQFTKEDDTNPDYDIYYYLSSMPIQPLAQAQFFLYNDYDSNRATTVPWET